MANWRQTAAKTERKIPLENVKSGSGILDNSISKWDGKKNYIYETIRVLSVKMFAAFNLSWLIYTRIEKK